VHQSAVERAEQGIPDGFVRISVGVEDAEDLKADFRQALHTLKSSAVA
jgi:cystathionine beta-lyase/cystathionine gamma-synthase